MAAPRKCNCNLPTCYTCHNRLLREQHLTRVRLGTARTYGPRVSSRPHPPRDLTDEELDQLAYRKLHEEGLR